jgi:hypothetical protein
MKIETTVENLKTQESSKKLPSPRKNPIFNQTRKIGQPVKQKTNEIKSQMNPC